MPLAVKTGFCRQTEFGQERNRVDGFVIADPSSESVARVHSMEGPRPVVQVPLLNGVISGGFSTVQAPSSPPACFHRQASGIEEQIRTPDGYAGLLTFQVKGEGCAHLRGYSMSHRSGFAGGLGQPGRGVQPRTLAAPSIGTVVAVFSRESQGRAARRLRRGR